MLISFLESIPLVHEVIEDNEVYDKFRKGMWKDRIKCIWMAVSMVCNVILAAILTHFICTFLGLLVISKTVQDSKCYFINSRSPDTCRSPQEGGSGEADADLARIRRARMLAEIEEDVDARPRAETKINDDNTVDFFLNCEASLCEASTGAVWDIIPKHTIERSPVYA
jgi:hypothetical protein